MSVVKLSPNQWPKILEFLHSQPDLYVGKEAECKQFVEAVLWIGRSGHSGGCFRPSMASGIAYTSGLYDGASEGSGSGCTSTSSMILIWNTSLSTARSFERILALRGRLKKRWSSITGPRSEQRRVHYESPCERGQPRKPSAVHTDRRTGGRYHPG